MPDRGDRPSLRRRATSFLLAVTINLLLLIALLTLNPPTFPPPQFKGSPITLDLSPDEASEPTATKQKEIAEAEPETPPPAAAPVPPPVVPPAVPPDRPPPFIVLTREEFAAADIAKLGTRGVPAAPGRQAEAGRAGSGDTPRVGTAPNGEPLYAAQWYRRPPSDAELSPYLPKRMPREGWGQIACRTVEGYRVEDCVEVGNSPPGSHLAGAVRQAAWQFRVRPPRVGGKELVGTWVQIRIEYSVAEISSETP